MKPFTPVDPPKYGLASGPKIVVTSEGKALLPTCMHGTVSATAVEKLGSIGPVIGNDCAPVSGLVRVGSPSGLLQAKTVCNLLEDVAMANWPSGETAALVSFCPSGILPNQSGPPGVLPAGPPATAPATLVNGMTNMPPLTPVANR